MGEDLTFEMLVPETLLNWRRRALAAEARAQHMDELVGAAQNMVGFYSPGSNPYADEAWNNLRAILAKIGGVNEPK